METATVPTGLNALHDDCVSAYRVGGDRFIWRGRRHPDCGTSIVQALDIRRRGAPESERDDGNPFSGEQNKFFTVAVVVPARLSEWGTSPVGVAGQRRGVTGYFRGPGAVSGWREYVDAEGGVR